MRFRVPRLFAFALVALALIASGCRSADPRPTQRDEESSATVPRFSKSGVPDSVILRPQTDGGFGSGPLQ